MQTITLLSHVASKYGVLGQMIADLQAALKRAGIHSAIRKIDEKNPSALLPQMREEAPDCTWGINTLIGENLFYYPLGIPHVCLSVDAVTYSHEAIFAQPHVVSLFADTTSCDLFSTLSENPVHYFPHAVAKETLDAVRMASPLPLQERPFDIALIGSFIDHEEESEFWKTYFSPSDVDLFISLAEQALSDASFAFLKEALCYIEQTKSVQKVLADKELSPFSLANSLERYIRGLDRERLIQRLRGRKIHIFTSEKDASLWSKKPSAKDCFFHPPVPFNEVINICRQSKIVLQSVPTIRKGYHERLFLSLASGAVTLVNRGIPLPSWLTQTGRIVEYSSSSLEGLVSQLQEAEKQPFDSEKILSWLEQEHSWDARLVQTLPYIEKSVERIHRRWAENPFWSLLS